MTSRRDLFPRSVPCANASLRTCSCCSAEVRKHPMEGGMLRSCPCTYNNARRSAGSPCLLSGTTTCTGRLCVKPNLSQISFMSAWNTPRATVIAASSGIPSRRARAGSCSKRPSAKADAVLAPLDSSGDGAGARGPTLDSSDSRSTQQVRATCAFAALRSCSLISPFAFTCGKMATIRDPQSDRMNSSGAF